MTASLDPALRPTGFNPFTHVKMHLAVVGPDSHTYEVPVVCGSYQSLNESDPPTATATYPVHFFPVELGLHSYTLEVTPPPNPAGLTFSIPAHLNSPGKTFTAVPSANLSPWRTQGDQDPYEYPFAPHLLDGQGNRHYRYPLSATWYNIINPDPGVVSKRAQILDFMVSKNMNRIRVALNIAHAQHLTNHYSYNSSGSTYRHAIWPRINSTGDFHSANMDFERFDLVQWNLIDAFLAECGARDIHVSMILMMPGTSSYAADIFGLPVTSATWPPGSAPTITDAASAFPTRWELYYWYLIGRLCTYTQVHYCPMLEYHLMRAPQLPFGNGFSHNFASGAATAFVAKEPYLNRDGSSRLISVQGQRGSFYSRPLDFTGLNGAAAVVGCATDPDLVGYDNAFMYPSRISQRIFPFLDPVQHPFRNYMAHHFGGETGLASIVQMLDYAASHPPANPTAGPGHRQILESTYNAPCPIFIEEDWVAREDGTREISPSNHNEDNPYRFAMRGQYEFCRVNPFAFDFLAYPTNVHPDVEQQPFLSVFTVTGPNGGPDPAKVAIAAGNINGVEKFYRDSAWMTGLICQAYPCWFGPFYADPVQNDYVPPLSALKAPNSLASAGVWAQNNRWWTLRYDGSIVVSQAPAITLIGPASNINLRRFPHELQAIGAYRDEVGATQYLIYCPYGAFSATQSPVPATLTLNLARVGANQTFSYRFQDPDNYDPDADLHVGTTDASGQVVLTPGTLDPTGPYGEFVLEINP